jgi:hypothetical protein
VIRVLEFIWDLVLILRRIFFMKFMVRKIYDFLVGIFLDRLVIFDIFRVGF